VVGPRIEWAIEAQAAARGVTPAQIRSEFEAQSPPGRLTAASDVAEAAVYLASAEAGAITGVDLNVNAGVVMY
jgi:enoyl-[acyl-carrier-protein] reductase (NADH)